MYYLIDTILRKCSAEECHSGKNKYVAVLSPEEWNNESESYDMGIDIEPDTPEIYTTNAEVNYDSVTGTFAIPDRSNMSGEYHKFAFALDEKGIVFIDAGSTVSGIINKITETKKWRLPLTLIVGWYGMNFKYMPELDSVIGYPVVIVVSLLIIILSLLFFKRKKWL